MWNLIPDDTRPEESFVRQYIRTHPGVERSTAVVKYRKAMQCMFGMDRPTKRIRVEDGSAGAGGEAGGADWTRDFHTEMFFPPTHPGLRKLVNLTDSKCVTLPTWMNEVLDRVPFMLGASDDESFALHMDPHTGQYIFGVCGTPNEAPIAILQRVRDHPFFQHCFPTPFQTDVAIMPSYKSITDDLHDFCVNPKYTIALFVIGAENRHDSVFFGHVRLLIKDGTDDAGRLKLVITDPHGTYDGIVSADDLVIIEQNLVAAAREKDVQITVRHSEQFKDQGPEGSCGAMAFMRMTYILYRAHISETNEPLLYVNERVPCVFAVFVSRLFHRVNVINRRSFDHVVGVTRHLLGDFTFTENPPPNSNRHQWIEYIKRQGIANNLASRMERGHSSQTLTDKVLSMVHALHRSSPTNPPPILTHSEISQITRHIYTQDRPVQQEQQATPVQQAPNEEDMLLALLAANGMNEEDPFEELLKKYQNEPPQFGRNRSKQNRHHYGGR